MFDARLRSPAYPEGYDRGMGYKLLGFAVWRGTRWYVRRRMARIVPPRRVVAGALVASVVGAIVVAAAAQHGSDE